MAFLNALVVADQFHYFLGNSYIKIKRKYDYLTLKVLKFNKNICNVVIISRSSIWVLLELICRWKLHFTKMDQARGKIEQICIWNPMTTGFITLTLIYIISMQFLLLSGRHSSAQNVLSSKEQGETAVFAGYWLSNVRRIQSTQIVYFIFSYDKRLYIYTFCLGITHTRVSFSHLKLLIFYPI